MNCCKCLMLVVSLCNIVVEAQRQRIRGQAAEASEQPHRLYQHEGGYLCWTSDSNDNNTNMDHCYHPTEFDRLIKHQFFLAPKHEKTTAAACVDFLQPEGTCRKLIVAAARDTPETAVCAHNPTFWHSYCPVTCHVCHNRTQRISLQEEEDETEYQVTGGGRWSQTNQKKQQRDRTRTQPIVPAAAAGVGVGQVMTLDFATASRLPFPPGRNLPEPQDVARLLSDVEEYMMEEVRLDDRYRPVRQICRNRHPHCALRALRGDCENDEYREYMIQQCAPMCFACHELHYETRCPVNPNLKHALYPGDLHKLFERILQDPHYRDRVQILSRPTLPKGLKETTLVDYKVGGPWIILIHNFVSNDECDTLIRLGAKEGYKRSQDVGEELDDGVLTSEDSKGRTSTNAWCETDTCESHPRVQSVLRKMERLTGLHRNYSEHLQLLRYQPGQFYDVHHDYIESERLRVTGVRILTLFLYLNDVAEGGATDFPDLNITVYPSRGSALLWPSVLDHDPHERDDRTFHQALPVNKGVKYGANAWFHQRHVRVAQDQGC